MTSMFKLAWAMVAALVLAGGCSPSPTDSDNQIERVSSAQTVAFPPITITGFQHVHSVFPTSVFDADRVDFPCSQGGGFIHDTPKEICDAQTSFTATIGTGDNVIVRYQAPAGQKFSFNRPAGGTQNLGFAGKWTTVRSDGLAGGRFFTVNWENVVGPPGFTGPALNFCGSRVTLNGESIDFQCVTQDPMVSFTFTALEAVIPVANTGPGIPRMARTYFPIDQFDVGAGPGLSAGRSNNNPNEPDITLLQLVPQ